jgi:aminoglycoside 2'-N-acetyltransferase I
VLGRAGNAIRGWDRRSVDLDRSQSRGSVGHGYASIGGLEGARKPYQPRQIRAYVAGRPYRVDVPRSDEPDPEPHMRAAPTGELSDAEVAAIRDLLDRAFGDDPDGRFDEDDWRHAIGGLHLIAELDRRIVGHASVVARTLWIDGQPTRTGYVEAVATEPGLQGRGIGTMVMRAAGSHISEKYDLGALGTGEHRFYERLGWRTWQGPSSVRTPDGERHTPDEDGFILVLETPGSPRPLRINASIACDWRAGDVW